SGKRSGAMPAVWLSSEGAVDGATHVLPFEIKDGRFECSPCGEPVARRRNDFVLVEIVRGTPEVMAIAAVISDGIRARSSLDVRSQMRKQRDEHAARSVGRHAGHIIVVAEA